MMESLKYHQYRTGGNTVSSYLPSLHLLFLILRLYIHLHLHKYSYLLILLLHLQEFVLYHHLLLFPLLYYISQDQDNVRNYNESNKNERSGKTNRSHEFSNTNEYLEHIVGKTPGKSYSKMLSEYRETLLNVDMMVINELNNLFMLVW